MIYICGPMSGIKDYNRPKFNRIAEEMRREGYDVFNPAEIKGQPNWGWQQYMRRAISGMMTCDLVYVLNGWETSKGANIEIDLANKMDIEMVYEKDVNVKGLHNVIFKDVM